MKKSKNILVVFSAIIFVLALAGCQNPFLQLGKEAISSASSPFNQSTSPITAYEDGSEDHPFLVYDTITLKRVGSGEEVDGKIWALDKHYLQTRDINWSEAGENWTPIGDTTNFFSGSYNGGGKIILNLKCVLPSTTLVGLFTTLKGTVINLGIVNANIEGYAGVGGFAGQITSGTIQNCFFTGSVKGNRASIGGIAGGNFGLITNCFVNSEINCHGQNAGGIAGFGEGGEILNCYTMGTVYGTYNVGGIEGRSNGARIENCVALNSSVESFGDTISSIGRVHGGKGLGSDADSEVNNCYGSLRMGIYCAAVPVHLYDPDLDGIDVNYTEYTSESWWIDIANWDFDNVWEWSDYDLPLLQNMGGQ